MSDTQVDALEKQPLGDELPAEVAQLLGQLNPRQLTYINAYQGDNAAEALEAAGVAQNARSNWFVRSEPFRQLVGMIDTARRAANANLVISKVSGDVGDVVDEVHKLAFSEPKDGRSVDIKFRALLTLLRLAGIQTSDPVVKLTINNNDNRQLSLGQLAVAGWSEVGPDGLTGAQRFRVSQERLEDDMPTPIVSLPPSAVPAEAFPPKHTDAEIDAKPVPMTLAERLGRQFADAPMNWPQEQPGQFPEFKIREDDHAGF